MKIVGSILLLAATAHAEPVGYVEGGAVTAIDFGVAPSRPIELGLRVEGVGAALAFEAYVPGKYSDDRSVSVSVAVDAFVSIGF